MPITIFIIDDHKILRETWEKILNDDPRFQVIGTFESGEAAMVEAYNVTPDIALMDVKLPGMNGIEATRIIRKISPKTKVIGFSFYADVLDASGMFREGARGYITKNCDVEEVFIALINIYNGHYYVCEEMKQYRPLLLP